MGPEEEEELQVGGRRSLSSRLRFCRFDVPSMLFPLRLLFYFFFGHFFRFPFSLSFSDQCVDCIRCGSAPSDEISPRERLMLVF